MIISIWTHCSINRVSWKEKHCNTLLGLFSCLSIPLTKSIILHIVTDNKMTIYYPFQSREFWWKVFGLNGYLTPNMTKGSGAISYSQHVFTTDRLYFFWYWSQQNFLIQLGSHYHFMEANPYLLLDTTDLRDTLDVQVTKSIT